MKVSNQDYLTLLRQAISLTSFFEENQSFLLSFVSWLEINQVNYESEEFFA